jgi:hypothetical protein
VRSKPGAAEPQYQLYKLVLLAGSLAT